MHSCPLPMTSMHRRRLSNSIISQGDLPYFLNFYCLDIGRGSRYVCCILLDVTPCGLNYLPICISRLPLPARLQAPRELEAGKDVRFGINDYRIQW